jgi:2-polyprenyl-3-methyl-5-hydroxy-6-metoxy-1,4-benzoquinol methylase
MDAKTYLETHWMKHEVWNRLLNPIHQERLRKCAESVKGGTAFVDIGCGCGHSTAIMKGFCPGDWTGVDFGESAIAEARKLFPDISFLYCLRTSDIPTDGWDGVVCSEVIEHVEDPKDFVLELWHLTAPGGVLVVTTPNRPVNDPGHLRVFSRLTLTALFEQFPGTAEIRSEGRFFYVIARKEK